MNDRNRKQYPIQVSMLAKQIVNVYEKEGRVDEILATSAAEDVPGHPVIEVDFGDDVVETWVWGTNPHRGKPFPGGDPENIDNRFKVWSRTENTVNADK